MYTYHLERALFVNLNEGFKLEHEEGVFRQCRRNIDAYCTRATLRDPAHQALIEARLSAGTCTLRPRCALARQDILMVRCTIQCNISRFTSNAAAGRALTHVYLDKSGNA